jgi:hypothetical protein
VKIGNTFPKSLGSESWPQEKQNDRDETERQKSLKVLFADLQHILRWQKWPRLAFGCGRGLEALELVLGPHPQAIILTFCALMAG